MAVGMLVKTRLEALEDILQGESSVRMDVPTRRMHVRFGYIACNSMAAYVGTAQFSIITLQVVEPAGWAWPPLPRWFDALCGCGPT